MKQLSFLRKKQMVQLFVVAMLAGMVGYELLDRFIHAPRKAKLNPS